MGAVIVPLANGGELVIDRPPMGEKELRLLDTLTWQANDKRLEREAQTNEVATRSDQQAATGE